MAEHDPVVDDVWNDFHSVVNMTGQELREWLLTNASGENAFGADPAHPVWRKGEAIVNLLNKRRVDVTDGDVELMREVSEFVRDQLADPRREDAEWRHRLMSVGHDPLSPDSARPDEEEDLER
ncbi:hypothetical protein A6A08_02725 [Nocardiopsis sp. TSRI0078]|uniref:DUF3140 domain-containing protein n=1 Tax=unclassified Nocardiopsis TaxID=2649073 RepID=UPI00093D2A00|nr:DUF3140 domain-containing protein [Nocardiopsis sp. TSRI0078]OKI23696.1 hypothetical protein A6A08_02725 [Nocardiopsis sp. TSRI0078]